MNESLRTILDSPLYTPVPIKHFNQSSFIHPCRLLDRPRFHEHIQQGILI